MNVIFPAKSIALHSLDSEVGFLGLLAGSVGTKGVSVCFGGSFSSGSVVSVIV